MQQVFHCRIEVYMSFYLELFRDSSRYFRLIDLYGLVFARLSLAYHLINHSFIEAITLLLTFAIKTIEVQMSYRI